MEGFNPWSTLSGTSIQRLGPHRAPLYCRSDAFRYMWPCFTRIFQNFFQSYCLKVKEMDDEEYAYAVRI